MRKIKFRAWNEISGIMRQDLNLYNVSILANSIANHKFMQFTGLIDKKGKEIYEGDIIKYRVDGTNEKIWINEIIWKQGCLLIKNEDAPPIVNDTIYNIEIIGNIYENPELLEGEEKC